MPLLDDKIKTEVQKTLAAVTKPVKLVIFTQEQDTAPPCQFCADTRQLVEEVAALSEQLAAEVHDFTTEADLAEQYQIDKIPAVAVVGAKDYGVRFFGIPSGYEFGTLVQSILDVSTGESGLSESSKTQLARLDKPVHVQVLVTPTCPYCQRAVSLAHKIAIESDLVRADMVEVSEFPHLANKYQVFGVPRTVINETIHVEGAVPEAMLMAELMKVLDLGE
ncbi:MAG: thioredoxin family protein [Thermoflexales bacterium]|nr:thioredoxin family protein [Thermoflexales bacterium]